MFTGIVEAVGRVESVTRDASGLRARFGGASFEGGLSTGESVAVSGVSLTVASVTKGSFMVALIPHTLKATTLGRLRAGDEVNLEADILAKYVKSLLKR